MMIFLSKIFPMALVGCCFLLFTSVTYAHSCTGIIVNDSSGVVKFSIKTGSGGYGNFYVARLTGGTICSPIPSNTYGSVTVVCTIPNKNAGLYFIFSHTEDTMLGTISIEANGQVSQSVQFAGATLGDEPCPTGALQIRTDKNRVCVAGVCATSDGDTNNIIISDE